MLARKGHDVVLFEREHFPRDHIGESLLPASLPVLEVARRQRGGRAGRVPEEVGCHHGLGQIPGPMELVLPRDKPTLSPLLSGVAPGVRRACCSTTAAGMASRSARGTGSPMSSSTGERASAVRVEGEDGSERMESADFVVDASGQAALIGRARQLRRWDPYFRNMAVYGYFAGAERLDPPDETNILVESYPSGWFWTIPLHTGVASVGAVVDRDVAAERVRGGGLAEFLMAELAMAPKTASLLRPGPAGQGAHLDPRLVVPVRLRRRGRLRPGRRRRLLCRPALLVRSPSGVERRRAGRRLRDDGAQRRQAGRRRRAGVPGAVLHAVRALPRDGEALLLLQSEPPSRTSGRRRRILGERRRGLHPPPGLHPGRRRPTATGVRAGRAGPGRAARGLRRGGPAGRGRAGGAGGPDRGRRVAPSSRAVPRLAPDARVVSRPGARRPTSSSGGGCSPRQPARKGSSAASSSPTCCAGSTGGGRSISWFAPSAPATGRTSGPKSRKMCSSQCVPCTWKAPSMTSLACSGSVGPGVPDRNTSHREDQHALPTIGDARTGRCRVSLLRRAPPEPRGRSPTSRFAACTTSRPGWPSSCASARTASSPS